MPKQFTRNDNSIQERAREEAMGNPRPHWRRARFCHFPGQIHRQRCERIVVAVVCPHGGAVDDLIVARGRNDPPDQIDLLFVQLRLNGFDAAQVKEQPVLIDPDVSVGEPREH